jgi:ATP-dependent metallopeptidase hflB3
MKNKRAWIYLGFMILIVIIIGGICAANFGFRTSSPGFVSTEKLMQGISDKSIYAIAKFDDDTVWFLYKDDVVSDIEIKTAKQLTDIADITKWKSTKFKMTEDIYTQVCTSGIYYYSELPLSVNNIDPTLFFSVFGTVVIPLLMFFVFFFYIRKTMSTVSTSVSGVQDAKKSEVTFADVIGHDEIIEDLKQYIGILQNSDRLKKNHIRQPKGLLLTGSPGTGKTLLAKALAGEANVPFIYLNSSSVIDRYVGMGASNIRATFKKAREIAPCILFIDEIDAIGCSRENNSGRNSEDDKTLLALLQEMDGFADMAGVLVIGATNCPDKLDPALKRTGRFDREIHILPPRDKATRLKLLEHYTKDLSLSNDVDLEALAAQLDGFTGADIAYICNEAAIIAISKANSDEYQLVTNDFTEAVDKLLLKGNKRLAVVNKHDQMITAYHEAGHAIAAILLGHKVIRATIHSTTSGVGGFVMQGSSENQMQTKQELEDQIRICYAGRASEYIKFKSDGITTGASNDIQKATSYIKAMVSSFGYDEESGLLDYAQLAPETTTDMISRINMLAHKYFNDVLTLLSASYDKVELLVEYLIKYGELTGQEINDLLEKGSL